MKSQPTSFIKLFIAFIIFILSQSCSTNSEEESISAIAETAVEKSSNKLKYAKGFEIEEREGVKVITLKDAWRGDKTSYQYVLYKNYRPAGFDGATFVKVPIKKIACMSLTHVAMIEKLNKINSVVAISGCDFSNSVNVHERLKNNKIKEVGNSQKLNFEILINEEPDIVMAYGIEQSSGAQLDKFKEVGLSVVLNAEYMELHPLGQMEWIKFIAAFYGVDKEANIIFDEVEKEYLELTMLTKDLSDKPSAFSGMPWNGSWHVPGGKSFAAQLYKDAGVDYLWNDNNEKGSFVKSKEIILDEALDADFWLNLNSYNSMEAVLNYDERFNNFLAFKQKRLFNNNKRLNKNGGNAYFETGVVNPHIVLKDLIEIFHPELLEHELYYYQRLE